MRCVWGAILLAGFALWCWAVHDWAVAHNHQGLVDGQRPLYFAVAAITFWPTAILLWRLMYPNDDRALPWADK
jgi:hypothetical protein